MFWSQSLPQLNQVKAKFLYLSFAVEMSMRMKRPTGWVQRIRHLQETGWPFNDRLFLDTCQQYQFLHSKKIKAYHPWFESAIEFSSDGNFIAIGENNGSVLLWPIIKIFVNNNTQKKSNPMAMKTQHTTGCYIPSLAISQDNRRVLSGGADCKVIIHDSER